MACREFPALAETCAVGALSFYFSLFMCNHATHSHMFSAGLIDKDANEHAPWAQNWESPVFPHRVPECFALGPCTAQQFVFNLMKTRLVTGTQFSLEHPQS